IAMTRTLHLQHRVATVRSTYGSNPPDVAARLERGAHLQLPGTRRISDQTRQSRQPVTSDIAERRDDGVRQPIRNSKRSRHASAPWSDFEQTDFPGKRSLDRPGSGGG